MECYKRFVDRENAKFDEFGNFSFLKDKKSGQEIKLNGNNLTVGGSGKRFNFIQLAAIRSTDNGLKIFNHFLHLGQEDKHLKGDDTSFNQNKKDLILSSRNDVNSKDSTNDVWIFEDSKLKDGNGAYIAYMDPTNTEINIANTSMYNNKLYLTNDSGDANILEFTLWTTINPAHRLKGLAMLHQGYSKYSEKKYYEAKDLCIIPNKIANILGIVNCGNFDGNSYGFKQTINLPEGLPANKTDADNKILEGKGVFPHGCIISMRENETDKNNFKNFINDIGTYKARKHNTDMENYRNRLRTAISEINRLNTEINALNAHIAQQESTNSIKKQECLQAEQDVVSTKTEMEASEGTMNTLKSWMSTNKFQLENAKSEIKAYGDHCKDNTSHKIAVLNKHDRFELKCLAKERNSNKAEFIDCTNNRNSHRASDMEFTQDEPGGPIKLKSTGQCIGANNMRDKIKFGSCDEFQLKNWNLPGQDPKGRSWGKIQSKENTRYCIVPDESKWQRTAWIDYCDRAEMGKMRRSLNPYNSFFERSKYNEYNDPIILRDIPDGEARDKGKDYHYPHYATGALGHQHRYKFDEIKDFLPKYNNK